MDDPRVCYLSPSFLFIFNQSFCGLNRENKIVIQDFNFELTRYGIHLMSKVNN